MYGVLAPMYFLRCSVVSWKQCKALLLLKRCDVTTSIASALVMMPVVEWVRLESWFCWKLRKKIKVRKKIGESLDCSVAGSPKVNLSQLWAHGFRLWVSALTIFQLKGLIITRWGKNLKNSCDKWLTTKLLIYWNVSLLNHCEIFPVAMCIIAFMFMVLLIYFIGEIFMLMK